MTQIVVTAIAETPDLLYDRIRQAAASPADWIEVRLDGPSGLPWDLRSFFAFPLPCLATVRHTLDGGRSDADDRTRAEILRRALLAGARGIDVEAWSDEAGALVKDARAAGALVVVSRHLQSTPSAEEIVGALREMRALGADVAKLATRIERPEDAAALVIAAQAARDEGIPYALMAVNDPMLRLVAPTLGMALVYASVPGQPGAAPGQVPVDLVRRAVSGWHPGGSRVDGETRAVFLLGHPVARSKSATFQNPGFVAAGVNARYLALDVAPEHLAATLAGLKVTNALGANLTMPHKEAAIPLMDELDASARASGAVNTVVFREGRAIGHNTDGIGAVDALRERGVKIAGARVLMLGAGGAARGIAHALRDAGADVTLANRTPARASALGFPTIPWERVPDVMRNVDVLVNATSVGFEGEPAPAPVAKMLPGAAVLDIVVGETALVRDARAAGLLAIRGESMLLHQGARGFTLWTGKPAPLAAMRSALEGS